MKVSGFILEYRRRAILPLVGLALTAYYLFVIVPLDNRADSLDAPLKTAWQKLAGSVGPSNALSIDFTTLTNQLAETQAASLDLQKARREALARLEVPAELQAHLSSPFQLVDFESERSKQLDQIVAQAKAAKAVIDPAVLAGFPEHTAGLSAPALLWVQLAMVECLLKSSVQCRVDALHALTVPAPSTNNSTSLPGLDIHQIRIDFEFTSAASNALNFVQSLPLRGEELKVAGSPVTLTNKLPLFIERLVVKKQTPEKMDEVRVRLRLLGFVVQE
jgi:hypothetical protein